MKRRIVDSCTPSTTSSSTVTSTPTVSSSLIPRRLEFDSDSDEEVTFNFQANKRRKTTMDEETRIWITNQFAEQTKLLATKEQLDRIAADANHSREQSEKNAKELAEQRKDLAGIHGSLRSLEMQMNDSRRGFDTRVRRIVTASRSTDAGSSSMYQPQVLPNQQRGSRTEAEDAAFEKARRSLRIWPMEDNNGEEMMKSVKDFCYNALLINKDTDLGIESVSKVRSAPRGVAFMEVLVVFIDNFSRDRVFSSGPKLAGYRDEENKPTCGIRLHIPPHLMSQFKTLESFTSALRFKHGNQMKKTYQIRRTPQMFICSSKA